jgi:hypothetical protein
MSFHEQHWQCPSQRAGRYLGTFYDINIKKNKVLLETTLRLGFIFGPYSSQSTIVCLKLLELWSKRKLS